jgi:hypothetical protein
VHKPDYAKWQLDDPRVNFAISTGRDATGVNHLGIQADSGEELEALHQQLQQADLATVAEHEVACCYARSDKYWVTDPTGLAWETFHTLGSVPTFSGDIKPESAAPVASACCAPATSVAKVALPSLRAKSSCGA